MSSEPLKRNQRTTAFWIVAVAAVSVAVIFWLWLPMPFRRPPSTTHVVCSDGGQYCLELDIWHQGALGADYAEVYLRRGTDRRRSPVATGHIFDVATAAKWTADDRFEVELRDEKRNWTDRKFRVSDRGGALRAIEE